MGDGRSGMAGIFDLSVSLLMVHAHDTGLWSSTMKQNLFFIPADWGCKTGPGYPAPFRYWKQFSVNKLFLSSPGKTVDLSWS
jgi:hypothetical protein